MARQSKTPRQRAEEQLALARRIADRFQKKLDHDRAALEELEKLHSAAVARAEFLEEHPDLGQPATSTTPTTTSTGDTRA